MSTQELIDFETMLETIEEFEDYFDTILVEDDFEHSHRKG